MRRLFVIGLVAIACGHAPDPLPKPGTPDDLAAYLRTIVGADEAVRRREIDSWIVDATMWHRTITPSYRELYTSYVDLFDVATPPLIAQLAAPAEVTARRHYAGDPRLTRAEARLRWALPVQYPSAVAELAGRPIDAVFLYDGAHWRALLGLDALVIGAARALDPACAKLLELAGPLGHCTEVGFVIADAALLHDDARFRHACQLATTLCGNATP